MKPTSIDLRERTVAAYDAGEGSRQQVADRFKVSLGLVKKLLDQRRNLGTIEPQYQNVDRKRVLRLYIRRWECEEAIRFLKSQVNLEKIRTFHWIAICRLVLLVVLVMIYLFWLVEEHPNICKR